MNQGYIKLHRRLEDAFFYSNEKILKLFIHLLIKANYKDDSFLVDGKKKILKRGQIFTSRKKLAVQTGLKENFIQRSLLLLESEQVIEQQKTNKYRIISICNWDMYQDNEQQSEQQIDSRSTTNRQQIDTSKEVKKLRKNKEDNICAKSDAIAPHFDAVWGLYGLKKGKVAAKKAWDKLSSEEHKKAYEAIPEYLASLKKTKFQQKYLQGWLNDKRWQDEFSEGKKQTDEFLKGD